MPASSELSSPHSLKAAPLVTTLVVGLIALGGCTSQSTTPGEPALLQFAPAPEQVSLEHAAPADFRMVDCQLPPRIHRLGTKLVYLGPTRQVRTTSRDCVIRGGDFVQNWTKKAA